MKIRLALALFLVFILATTALGCSKVTGGGWFPEGDSGEKIVFSFNVRSLETYEKWTDLEGNIHINDLRNNVRVHGKSSPDEVNFRWWNSSNDFMAWDVTVNGKHHKYLYFWYNENYDPPYFWIIIVDDNEEPAYEWWGWEDDIKGGIKSHK